jgi:hypothetical protein
MVATGLASCSWLVTLEAIPDPRRIPLVTSKVDYLGLEEPRYL